MMCAHSIAARAIPAPPRALCAPRRWPMSGIDPPNSTTSKRNHQALAIQLQYVGFEDTPSRREYVLLAHLGDETRQYTVWIDQAAFAKRQALRQDGPDIC